MTTILDPEDVTSVELAGAYQQRWEYEMSLREIETQMLEPGAGCGRNPRNSSGRKYGAYCYRTTPYVP